MKARVNSWAEKYQDEEDGSITFDTYLCITTPDEEDIDFETAFATLEEATQWCKQFEDLLNGCSVTVSDWRVQYDQAAEHREEKEKVCFSQGTHIQALETLLRDAYPLLPQALRERADTLLQSEKGTVDADIACATMLSKDV